MKTKFVFITLVIAAIAAAGGWWAGQHFSHRHETVSSATSDGRRIRFYQCSMHPQVKSDTSGKCPICSMALSPIFEGQSAMEENLVSLDSNSISVINVQTETVQRKPLHRTLRVAGMIDDDETRHRIISAYNEGRIEKLLVNFGGAEVERNQPLAELYSPNLLTAEREYLLLARRDAADSTVNLSKEQKRLRASGKTRLKQLGLTEEQIVALEKFGKAEERTQILSPMSGTVVARNVYEGQYVKEGDTLFEIADFSTMWFRFDAYEEDLAWLKIGQKIEVTTPSVLNKMFEGKITFIDPNLSEPTRSAKVRVEISNPMVERDGKKQRELLHRLYADGLVKIDIAESLVVPRTAVLNSDGKPLVYIEQNTGVYEPRPIKLGAFGDGGWQILDGLKVGERVVTSGNLLIDAQAQFNSGGSREHQHNDSDAIKPMAFPALTETQENIAAEFFAVAGKISEALAADSAERFNEETAKLHRVLPQLATAFAEDSSRSKLVKTIEGSGHFPKAKDLEAARKSFVPFTIATTEFAKTVRREGSLSKLKIYKCPMANQGVSEAPKTGFWIQTSGPLRNPFFGEAMLDCGSEVQP